MKFKVRFQRRYSIFISIIACGMAIWMMVRNFGYPVDDVINIAWVSVILLVSLVAVAALIALLSRWIADRRK